MRIRIQSTESIGIMLALCLRNSAADLDPGMGKNPDPYEFMMADPTRSGIHMKSFMNSKFSACRVFS